MRGLRSLFALSLSVLVALPVTAQPPCLVGDDGLNVGCCLAPAPVLPAFPGIALAARWACSNNCALTQLAANITMAAPVGFVCDTFTSTTTINVFGPTGALIAVLNGNPFLKYSRTWREATATGGRQVWRFLVNGDFLLTSPTVVPAACLPPEAFAPYSMRVHLVGNVDYACDAATGGMTALLCLNRLPGCIQFSAASQTPVPALAVTNSSFHLVAPAPFNFAAIAEPQGNLLDEAVRPSRIGWPLTYACMSEEDVLQGQLFTSSQDCLCSGALAPTPWKHQKLSGTTCCGLLTQAFQSFAPTGLPLPTGFAARTLGAWPAAAGAFASGRRLTIYFGGLQYTDLCLPSPSIFVNHFVNGVSTIGPAISLFPAPTGVGCTPPSPVLPTVALDLQNQIPLAPASAAGMNLPGFGIASLSNEVWNLNL